MGSIETVRVSTDVSPSTVSVVGTEVPRIGFAGLHLAGPGGWGAAPDRDAAVALLRHALDAGVRYIDTADTLGPGASEEIIGETLHGDLDGIVVATKAGMIRAGERDWGVLGRPDYLKQQAKTSALRLRVERIPLFFLHRVDPSIPFDDQLGALVELRAEGVIDGIGLSAISTQQLEAARAITPIAAVQNHFNVVSRANQDVLDAAQALHIPFIAYWGLGHGRVLVDAPEVVAVATRLGATPAQVLLAWILQRSPATIAIPGTRSHANLTTNVESLHLHLDAEAIDALDAFDAVSRPVPDLAPSPAVPR